MVCESHDLWFCFGEKPAFWVTKTVSQRHPKHSGDLTSCTGSPSRIPACFDDWEVTKKKNGQTKVQKNKVQRNRYNISWRLSKIPWSLMLIEKKTTVLPHDFWWFIMPMASWASIFDVVPLPGPERERDYNIGIIGICHICQFMGLKSPWEASGTQEWQWKSPIHRYL